MTRTDELRRRAEEHLAKQGDTGGDGTISMESVRALLHELAVHQVELVMQNDELRTLQLEFEGQRRFERSEAHYRELFDFAPVGHLLLDLDTRIRDANVTAAAMLAAPRGALRGRKLAEFVAPEDQDAWFHTRRRLRAALGQESFELGFEPSGGERVHCRIVAVLNGRGADEELLHLAMVDVTEQQRAEAAARHREEQADRALRTAAARETLAEHRERRRIAKLLDDEVAQLLALAAMRMGALVSSAGERERDELRGVVALLQKASHAVVSLGTELSPGVLFEIGPRAAAQWLADAFEDQGRLAVSVSGEEVSAADEPTRVLLFRAMRELLGNVARHSGAHRAALRLWCDDDLSHLEISDRGRGFDPTGMQRDDGLGLVALRERVAHAGGSVEIDSRPGGGTRVEVVLPLHVPVPNGDARVGGEGGPPS